MLYLISICWPPSAGCSREKSVTYSLSFLTMNDLYPRLPSLRTSTVFSSRTGINVCKSLRSLDTRGTAVYINLIMKSLRRYCVSTCVGGPRSPRTYLSLPFASVSYRIYLFASAFRIIPPDCLLHSLSRGKLFIIQKSTRNRFKSICRWDRVRTMHPRMHLRQVECEQCGHCIVYHLTVGCQNAPFCMRYFLHYKRKYRWHSYQTFTAVKKGRAAFTDKGIDKNTIVNYILLK
ncbi:hypothetical protein PUN28_000114 [Cardiocondyla obscurior]|uniref:Uncharacterized protein n=1 Tax=Cardiocondyla obscurior TaxID=286306 RepID=A0AAW2GXW6_9HYME